MSTGKDLSEHELSFYARDDLRQAPSVLPDGWSRLASADEARYR